MKKTSKLLAILLVIAMVASACGNQPGTTTPAATTPQTTEAPAQTTPAATTPAATTPAATTAAPTTPAETEPPVVDKWDGAYMDKEDYVAYITHDLDLMVESIEDQLDDATYTAVKKLYDDGVAAIEAGETLAEVREAYTNAFNAIVEAIPTANGVYSYKKESNAERTNVLGILERFAIATGILGTSLYENGNYAMYNPRITLGTENYIVGYGFGTLAEGAITADLEYETNADWKRYYHTLESSDPKTLNYLNDQGAQVGDLYGYIGASFFETFMNETKDGYDWVPALAKEKPVPVNDEDGDGMCDTWRFEVRTGETDGLKYSTLSALESRQAFNDRLVALEDYETPFKVLLTKANNLYRGGELANMTGNGGIKGAKAYYDATGDGPNDELWENVGIKTYVEDGKNYFEFTFTTEQTAFYAMYYISSSLYMPIPQEFLDLVTVQYYLGFNSDATESPVDNSLVLGAYICERYDQDQQIVFKKNPNYMFADTKYQIEGVHVKIFPAAESDPNATIKEFLAEHFDSCGIPKDYLDDYRNDPRARSTKGDSVFKLNMNTCDQETWEYLFGVDGVIKQNAKEDYWDLKPALGNKHFTKALSYSIDRASYAAARGVIPSVDYLSSNYMSDPENGMSYSVTAAHKFAQELLVADTDGNGYSVELARDYFRMALTELEADGKYTPGTKENPTVIEIEIAWQRPAQEETYHNELAGFLETAFNDESVCGGVYQLKINFWVGNEWSDVYYNKMMVGQFDIGFGSISGNSLDPIGFFNVVSGNPDIANGFTLNWGVDTNSTDTYPLVYDGLRWSFDALYNAVNSQAITANGQNKAAITIEYTELVKNEDGTYTGSFTLTPGLPDETEITIDDVVCCNYERYRNGDGNYAESSLEEFEVTTDENGVVTVVFTVPAELAEEYATGSGTSAEPKGETGFDLYYSYTFQGAANNGLYYSVDDVFEVPEVTPAESSEAPAESSEAPAETTAAN